MSEFNLLLVDDEAVDLEWLRRRIERSSLPVRLAGTANNGFQALEILRQEPVDIVLSDIRMPIMSGLELARRAQEICPGVQFAFISGHDDFEYAKQAIRLNAFDYLLKPVKDGELYGMLSKLCAKVARERAEDRDLEETLTLVHRELFIRFLHGDVPERMEPRLRKFLEPYLEKGAALAVIEIDDWEWKTGELAEEGRQALFRRMADGLELAVKNGNFGALFPMPPNRFVLLSGRKVTEHAGAFESLVDTVRRKLPLTVTIGLGPTVQTLEQLPESFRGAQAALSAKWLVGKDRLIRDASNRTAEGGGTKEARARTPDRLFAAILDYDLVTIDDCLTELFREQAADKTAVYDMIVRITSDLYADLQKLNENLYELLQWENRNPGMLFRFETVHDILSWFRKRMFELSELLYTKRQRQNRKLIAEVMKAVEDGIEQKPTLKELAARFGFSPNYLGYLFKEETGMAFSDYVNEVRIRRVCELLLDPTLKIYEIADRCGYKNIIYFNRQFKQSTGMTPGEYRKKHKV